MLLPAVEVDVVVAVDLEEDVPEEEETTITHKLVNAINAILLLHNVDATTPHHVVVVVVDAAVEIRARAVPLFSSLLLLLRNFKLL